MSVIGKPRKSSSNILKKHAGFTLIEILIVVVILTIVASMALLATGDFGRERRIRTAGEELQSLATLLQTKAILTGNVLGIHFESNGYHFFEFNGQKKTWSPILSHKLFLPAHLPPGMKLVVQEPKNEKDSNQPDVTVLPGGELSVLKLAINNDDQTLLILEVENDHFVLREPHA